LRLEKDIYSEIQKKLKNNYIEEEIREKISLIVEESQKVLNFERKFDNDYIKLFENSFEGMTKKMSE